MPKLLKIFSSFFLFVLLTAGYHSLFYSLSIKRIATTEKYLMDTGLNVITAGINRRVVSMEVLANDWSYWDDSYDFMGGTSDTFYENELTDETLINMGTNMILFYNNNGNLVHKKTVSFDEYKEIVIPSELLDEKGSDSLKPFIASVSSELVSKRGLLHTPNGNLIFALAPILKSNGDGPVRGVILMGRYLNAEDEELIREGVGLNLSIHDYVNVPSNLSKKFAEKDVVFQSQGNSLVAYKIVRDQFNTPAFWMEFYYPKIVSNNWVLLMKIFAVIASAGTLLSGIVYMKTYKLRNIDITTE